MQVDIPEGAEGVGRVHDLGEVGDGVEDCDQVAEAGDEADADLEAEGFGDVLCRSVRFSSIKHYTNTGVVSHTGESPPQYG